MTLRNCGRRKTCRRCKISKIFAAFDPPGSGWYTAYLNVCRECMRLIRGRQVCRGCGWWLPAADFAHASAQQPVCRRCSDSPGWMDRPQKILRSLSRRSGGIFTSVVGGAPTHVLCINCRQFRRLIEFWRSGSYPPQYDTACRDCRNEYRRDHGPSYPIKEKARRETKNALKRGTIKKNPCGKCGNTKVEAHHGDYRQPLKVIWLCRYCHLRTAPGSHGGRCTR
jgi:hypothetical protein